MHGTGYGINLIKLIPYRLIPICTMSLERGAGYNARSTSVPQIKVTPGQHVRADIYIPLMQVDGCRGVCLDVSRVHNFHGSADNPSENGILRHSDINLVLSQRAQEKVDKYRAGYAAQGMRHASLPAVVSTSGRIHSFHGYLLWCDIWLLYIFADKKTITDYALL